MLLKKRSRDLVLNQTVPRGKSAASSFLSLRAWKLALAGPSVYWYFPIFYVLLSSPQLKVSPIGITALLVVLMISASWGFLLNDLFDRDADAKSGRADDIHGHGLSKRTMAILVLSTAVLSWLIVFSIGGGYIFKIVLAVNYLVGAIYSTPPIKLKIRRFWGFFANSVMERPLPILVFLTYMNYYNVLTILLPILMELSWSVFKHQAADVREDTEAGVSTFAVYLGESLSMKIVNYFLNPLSGFTLLFLIGLSWYNIPSLRLALAICFFITLIGTIASIAAEFSGRLTTYVTPTDPPYIMFLNLAYRFLLLPILVYGIVSLRSEYYPLLFPFAATFVFQILGYLKIVKKLRSRKSVPLISK